MLMLCVSRTERVLKHVARRGITRHGLFEMLVHCGLRASPRTYALPQMEHARS